MATTNTIDPRASHEPSHTKQSEHDFRVNSCDRVRVIRGWLIVSKLAQKKEQTCYAYSSADTEN
jgi:hypothetical protein